MRMPLLALAAALVVGPAFAAEVPLTTIANATGVATSYTATLGQSLKLQCPGQAVRYKVGNSGSPPTADSNSALLDFVENSRPYPVQLAPTEDRISIVSVVPGKLFKCLVFTESTPAVTTVTNLAASQCTLLPQTTVSVGLAAVTVPTSSQTRRLGVQICISGENPGLPKVKCLVDGTPVMVLGNPGDVLQIGGKVCEFYAVDSTHPIKCIADTATTWVTTNECVPP